MSITVYGNVHVVYHCRRDGEVIYVGCTSHPEKREKAQRQRLGNSIEFEVVAVFANRRHAYEYENSEIKRLRPERNELGNPDHYERVKQRKRERAEIAAKRSPRRIGAA